MPANAAMSGRCPRVLVAMRVCMQQFLARSYRTGSRALHRRNKGYYEKQSYGLEPAREHAISGIPQCDNAGLLAAHSLVCGTKPTTVAVSCDR
jgi:hypothetical protein